MNFIIKQVDKSEITNIQYIIGNRLQFSNNNKQLVVEIFHRIVLDRCEAAHRARPEIFFGYYQTLNKVIKL